jgi:hypothetical protein
MDYGFELVSFSQSGTQEIAPDSTEVCRMSFWAVDALPPLSSGLGFEIREGTRVVGHGRVIDVQNQ